MPAIQEASPTKEKLASKQVTQSSDFYSKSLGEQRGGHYSTTGL